MRIIKPGDNVGKQQGTPVTNREKSLLKWGCCHNKHLKCVTLLLQVPGNMVIYIKNGRTFITYDTVVKLLPALI